MDGIDPSGFIVALKAKAGIDRVHGQEFSVLIIVRIMTRYALKLAVWIKFHRPGETPPDYSIQGFGRSGKCHNEKKQDGHQKDQPLNYFLPCGKTAIPPVNGIPAGRL